MVHAQSSDSFVTPRTVAHQAPLPTGFPRQETRVGCHFILQGIITTEGLNSGLLIVSGFLLCRGILYQLSHQGSPTQLISSIAHFKSYPF